MYSNFHPFCCCCSDHFYFNNCCCIPIANYCQFDCCLWYICYPVMKRLSNQSKASSTTSQRMKSTSETNSGKSTPKIKKRTSKTKRTSQETQDDNANGGQEVRSSLSGSLIVKKANERISSDSLPHPPSKHDYSCKALEMQNAARQLDVPALIAERSGEQCLGSIYSNQACASPKKVGSRDKNYYSSDQLENENLLITNITALPCKPYCTCCKKVLPCSAGAFPFTKNCSQLDSINEEGEEHPGQCGSINSPPLQKFPNQSTKQGTHKSLEDSCADFLNIVCDNIMESVQSTVDVQLKEFTTQTLLKIDDLGQKLQQNELAVNDFCANLLDKINEQNQQNFKIFYNCLKNLLTQNQGQVRPGSKLVPQDFMHYKLEELEVATTFDPAVDSGPIAMYIESEAAMPGDYSSQEHEQRDSARLAQEQRDSARQSHEKRDSARLAQEQRDSARQSHEKRDSARQAQEQRDSARQSHEQPDSGLQPHEKSDKPDTDDLSDEEEGGYTACCTHAHVEEHYYHPCSPDLKDSTRLHPCDHMRNSGGCDKSEGKWCMLSKKEIQFWKRPKECSCIDSSQNLPTEDTELQRTTNDSQTSCISQKSPSDTTFTTFSLTPTGKTIFNCTCAKQRQDGRNQIVETCMAKTANENNDTSGYATEPDDSNNVTILSSVIQKTPQMDSKLPCNSQSSSETKINPEEEEKTFKRSSSQPTRRLHESFSKSTPSRLFRL